MAILINKDGKGLEERINELILRSDELRFLVGFFYFSGFREIYESIKKNSQLREIKVLVGLNVDEYNNVLVEYGKDSETIGDNLKRRVQKTIGQTTEEVITELLNSYRKTSRHEDCDTKEFYESAKLFLDLLRQSKLLIRKTKEPNHSKLYLFHLINNTPPNIAILGSSNLTKSGLSENSELNVEIRDDDYLEKLVEYFDEQWINSIDLNGDDTKQRIIDVIENNSPIKSITPFEAYIYILYLYYKNNFVHSDKDDELNSFLEKKGYKPFKFQLDAVNQACQILNEHNGVILADVVGLGKSIIACLIGKKIKLRGIVIAPPGLIGDIELKTSGWAKYLNDFELYDWEIFSAGKLDQALERVKSENFDIVVVDEAHRFRNENTESYTYLQSICRGKKVVLLTATPFNNNPSDVFSYLKLFTIPKKSTLTANGDLESEFREMEDKYQKFTRILKGKDKDKDKDKDKSLEIYKKLFQGERYIDNEKLKNELKNISMRIKGIIQKVLIRRNRIDLKNNPYYKDEIKELPVVHSPRECFFTLNKELDGFYDDVLKEYFAEDGVFKGAVYRPDRYKKKYQSQKLIENTTNDPVSEIAPQYNLYDFMRRLLVKRFESSLFAFYRSLENFINFYQKCLDSINKTNRFIYNRSVIEDILRMDIDSIDETELNERLTKILEENGVDKEDIYPIENMQDSFIDDITSDIRLLVDVKDRLDKLAVMGNNDPKIFALRENLDKILKQGEKAIIFTEFVDTVKYLAENLNGYRIFAVTEKPTRHIYQQILENFDASYPKDRQISDFDILIVTDRFSEGYNLNRANHVFNFDIPWNPVRVIQRLGRINRIGTTPYKNLYIYNFFPTTRGEEQINLRRTAETKMFMIHRCLGEDAKIFSEEEEPTPSELYKRLNQNPEELGEEESLLTKVSKILNSHKDVQRKVEDLPRYIKVAKKYTENNLVLTVQRANGLYFFINNKEHPVSLDEVIKYIECDPDEPRYELSNDFWTNYQNLKDSYQKYAHNRSDKRDTSTRGALSDKERAINVLREIISKNPNWLDEDLRNFLENILEDLIEYSTLPKRIVNRIASIKPSKLAHDKNAMLKIFEEIRRFISLDYFANVIERSKQTKSEIIICIENQYHGG